MRSMRFVLFYLAIPALAGSIGCLLAFTGDDANPKLYSAAIVLGIAAAALFLGAIAAGVGNPQKYPLFVEVAQTAQQPQQYQQTAGYPAQQGTGHAQPQQPAGPYQCHQQ